MIHILSLSIFSASVLYVLSSLDKLGAPLQAFGPGRPPLGMELCLLAATSLGIHSLADLEVQVSSW